MLCSSLSGHSVSHSSLHVFLTPHPPPNPTPTTQIAHDPELLKDELRPLVFEEVRQQVDDEMRCLLANLKAMVAAEAAAKSGGWLELSVCSPSNRGHASRLSDS